jgi:hypothetical protein
MGWMYPPETGLRAAQHPTVPRRPVTDGRGGYLDYTIAKRANAAERMTTNDRDPQFGGVNNNLVLTNRWVNYNPAVDDAKLRQIHNTSDSRLVELEDDYLHHDDAAIRDEFRLVTLGDQGKREVGEGVVIGTSPDKMDKVPSKSHGLNRSQGLVSQMRRTPHDRDLVTLNGSRSLATTSEASSSDPGRRDTTSRACNELAAQPDGSSVSPKRSRQGNLRLRGQFLGASNRDNREPRAIGGFTHPAIADRNPITQVDNSDAVSIYTEGVAEWETNTTADSANYAHDQLGAIVEASVSAGRATDDEDVKDLIQF